MNSVIANRLYKYIAGLCKEGAFSGGHEIFTPKALVEEILDKVPQLENKSILVLFNLEFAVSLIYTYGVDKNNIRIYLDHPNKVKIANKLGIKVLEQDIFKVDNMKFDVVVGNPPYQDGNREDQANKLWPLFVKKAHDLVNLNGYVAFITPNSWMQPTADIGKGTGKNALSIFKDIFQKNNLIAANIDSEGIRNKYFKGVGSTFSYYIFQKANYSGSTDIVTENGTVLLDVTEFDSLPKVVSKQSLSIVKKMSGKPFKFCDQNHNLNGSESKSGFKFKIYHTNKKGGTYWFGEKLNPYASSSKVIISLSGKYLPVLNTDTGFSNMCLALICMTEKEAEQAQIVLSSKLYKFWVDMQKFSGFNPRKLILNLPALPLQTNWSDEKIYRHFGLTQEEIDYIEANVK
jgi:site-specific DNA-methyltransferase (adenine-specific)